MAEKKEQLKSGAPSHGVMHAKALQVGMIIVLVLAGVSVTCFGFLMYIDIVYAKSIFPGMWIGDVEVSGLTIDQARTVLNERAAVVERTGVTVTADGQEALIESTVASENEIDTAFSLYTYSFEPVIDAVALYGRSSNGLVNIWDRLRAYFSPVRLDAPFEFEHDRFIEILQAEFTGLEMYPKNAELVWSAEGGFSATDASSGSVFEYQRYAQDVARQLALIHSPQIALALVTKNPDVTRMDVESLIPLAQEVYGEAPFTITWEEHSWELTQEHVAAGLSVVKNGPQAVLGFSESGLSGLLDVVRKTTDIEAKDAKFQIVDNKVSEFQDSQAGRSVDIQTLLSALQTMIANKTYDSPIALVVTTVDPEVTASEAENLGITELVATGQTNFAGSPTNRRKNIANGVRLLNGILIKPGETFSLVDALRPIETSNGYLPELVIKGNRTIPEVGGGLCQIGTTMFRVVLNAGLPVVERKNHSYRVSYYEPPVGMDATIYDPAPDFKFTNDYGNYLLLLGRIEGNELYFDFWGTKDGRIIEMTKPKMYNVTSPGPTKYIETDDLAPGEQKCIEKAHNGASAEFTYTVTYTGGEKKEVTFYSKYKAWQAVCLVGKSTS